MRLKDGSLVGRYRVDRYIGEGGMQFVYKATDTLLQRTVALKTPKNDDGQRRFDRSAHLSAQVNHPNVARTLDYFTDSGTQYLAEEFVCGLDMGQLLKRVPMLDPYIVARALHGLARGLAAVHAVNVVHRDLKPSNLMAAGGLNLTDVKVTDFGVSKMAESEIDTSVAGGLLSFTGSKTLIGHLPYLAPEILRKRKTVDLRADIWAVGALAYHFLSGDPPFGFELADAVTNILTAPVPSLPLKVSAHPQLGGLAKEIYGIAVACLQRDPASRPTANELVTLCERLCYSIAVREIGRVNGYPGNTFGFAEAPNGRVFFHVDSVFGSSKPRVGSEIWFSRHPGEPHDRAYPVVALHPEDT